MMEETSNSSSPVPTPTPQPSDPPTDSTTSPGSSTTSQPSASPPCQAVLLEKQLSAFTGYVRYSMLAIFAFMKLCILCLAFTDQS